MTVLEQVAGAGWQRIAALQHRRVAHLLSADFHACVIAGTAFINLCLAMILLAALVVVAFGLSPFLAATVLLLLALLAAILYPSLAFARRSGTDLAALGLRMTSDLGQFLAGLKPALARNLEQGFVAPSAACKQSEARAATLLAAGLVDVPALAIGSLAFGVPAPQLLAILVVLARPGGPSLQLQQRLQLLHHSLPTYTRIKALERELARDAAGSAPPHPPLPAPPRGPIRLTA